MSVVKQRQRQPDTHLVDASEGESVVDWKEDFSSDDGGKDSSEDHHPELCSSQEHLRRIPEDRDRRLEGREKRHGDRKQGEGLVAGLELTVVQLLLAILRQEGV